jgi:glycine dehydrogenase subunit 1
MPYTPHTKQDEAEMLATIGVESIDDLFREIPPGLRVAPGTLDLPPALDEPRLMAHLAEIAAKNVDLSRTVSFLGAGIYDRYIPATVSAVISRGEFLTAYTPYQPEVSQGYLQTIYEFQTMIAELYGCDLANASMYDGATSMAEAAIMAHGVNGREKIAVSEAVHPHYRQVLDTYCWSMGLDVVPIPAVRGETPDYDRAEGAACIIVQYPNFFGVIEDLAASRREADRQGALLIVVADPTACALLEPPGAFGADVVVGEGQPLGIAMGLGGPLLGLFACKQEFVRRIPGRIVGRTQEAHGERTGYVMTLRTREQDIRREKATSNICTNEALMGLAATVYLAALGKNGMRQIAASTVRNTQYAIAALRDRGIERAFPGRVFGEFVARLRVPAAPVRDSLLEHGILAGLPLGEYYPGMENDLLIAVTEMRTREQIDRLAELLGRANA